MLSTAKVVRDTAMPNRIRVPITIYKGAKDPAVHQVLKLSELFEEIQNETPQAVEEAKDLKHFYKVNKTLYASLKENLNGFSIGQFSKRADKEVEIYTRYVATISC